jgi:hypothetical protein
MWVGIRVKKLKSRFTIIAYYDVKIKINLYPANVEYRVSS